jgi:hypothetical protein
LFFIPPPLVVEVVIYAHGRGFLSDRRDQFRAVVEAVLEGNRQPGGRHHLRCPRRSSLDLIAFHQQQSIIGWWHLRGVGRCMDPNL